MLINVDAELLAVARVLLAQRDEDEAATVEILFRHLLSVAEAQRGFIVLREGNDYAQKLEVNFDREAISTEERRYSRTLVRQAIRSGEIQFSANVREDARFAESHSVQGLTPASIVCAPLGVGGERYGAVYLERPVELPLGDDLREFLAKFVELASLFIRRSLERRALRERNQTLEHDLFAQHDFAGIVTRDPRLLDLLRTVAQVADAGAPVLVLGETGTGKELIARALHLNSARRARPFVTLHCGALPPTLLESELFGHVRGAFTGADRERVGRIASAHQSTLFLDEIAEIPPEVQVKLLRVVQFGELQRVGSDRVESVDVRIIAATHRDLPALVRADKFRQDLYFRLNVVEIALPALRERRGDLPILVDHALRRHWRRPGETPRLSARVERQLAGYAFPGNVRELVHMIERACLLATGPELDADLFPALFPRAAVAETSGGRFQAFTNTELVDARAAALADVEREFVDGLLRRCENNVSRAARDSDIPRSYLQRLIARHRRKP